MYIVLHTYIDAIVGVRMLIAITVQYHTLQPQNGKLAQLKILLIKITI